MSSLNSLFNRASFGVRCKTCLNLAISRIKLLRNKRDVQLKQMRGEIAQYLRTGQEAVARIRVEHVIREQNIMAAYDVLELFCEFVLARIPILEAQRECPVELQEAVASIIFASPRCSDLPEFMQIRNLFTAKYGKEFVAAASDLRPDSSVNRTVIEKLSVRAPFAALKIKVLKAIAQEYNLQWDSSSTEEEFSKTHEDLLDGTIPTNRRQIAVDNPADISTSTSKLPVASPKQIPKTQHPRSPVKKPEPVQTQIEESPGDERLAAKRSSSDVLERARAAIASAERASAAARAAAQLVNAKRAPQAARIKPCE